VVQPPDWCFTAAQVGMELTEEVTPLEAGLHGAVSLAKGCYIGQETLAKVRPARQE